MGRNPQCDVGARSQSPLSRLRSGPSHLREPASIHCLSDFWVGVILVLNASFRNKHSQEAKGRLSDQREAGVGTVEVSVSRQTVKSSC